MPTSWMRVGAVTFAAGVLAALVVNAAGASGCKASGDAGGPGVVKEPPAMAATASASQAAPASTASAPALEDDDEFMGASKSGRILRPRKPAGTASPSAAPAAP